MATISSAGVASGLDVPALVEQLVAAEGEPVRKRLDRKEAVIQQGLTSMASFRGTLSDFKTSLAELRNSDSLRMMKVETDDTNEEFVSITTNHEVSATEFNIDVNVLAKAHKLTSTQYQSDAVNVGSGSLTFQFGEYNSQSGQFILNSNTAVKTVKIEPENSSLRSISQAINNANIGVKTTIINDGKSSRIIFSSLSTGENNSLRITVNDDDTFDNDLKGLSTLAFDALAIVGTGRNIHQTQAAQDAEITIDGVRVKHASNTISGVIEGVSFDLHSLTSKSINVKMQLDKQAISNVIQNFVTSYNQLITTVDALSGYDSETQTAGPLSGDSSVRSVVTKLRRILATSFEQVNEKFSSLAAIGIETQRNGSLKVDQTKLAAVIESDLTEVINLFAKSGKTTDPRLQFVSATDVSTMGTFDVNITQIAKKGFYLGQAITHTFPLLIDENNDNLVVQVDGVSSMPLTLTHKSYVSLQQLADELQIRINSDENLTGDAVQVNVSVNAGRLQIMSNRVGSASRVSILSSDTNSDELGIFVTNGTDGVDVSGTIGGFRTNATGQNLIGTAAVAGLTVSVSAGEPGERGQVIFSRGIAAQLDLLVDKLLQSEGILSSRADGFNLRLGDISRQREVLDRRLDKLETRLMKQFTTLDSTLGKMRTTSEFLSNQLAGLPGASSPSRQSR